MKITQVETFILHVPVTREGIADSTHQITHWGAPGVVIHTDEGVTGFGYSGTHAHLPTDRLITQCIEDCFGPMLHGEDPTQVQHLWRKMAHYPPVQWVGRGGITHLALGAIDIALWDLKAKAALFARSFPAIHSCRGRALRAARCRAPRRRDRMVADG